ncbi:MAG: DUF2726 domain-containing protein [Candidatus Phlomobacter fragariae]
MLTAISVLIMLVIGILSFTLLIGNKNKKVTSLNYALVPSLMTKAELAFYQVLCDAVDGKYLVMAKVRMADIIVVKKGTKNYMALFGKIKSKHIDYLLCESLTLKPVLAIELDDKSHQKNKRVERDKFVKEVFSQVSLPILRQPCRSLYERDEVILNIQKLLG